MFRQIFERIFGSKKKIRITLEFEGEVCERFLSLVEKVGSNPRGVLVDSLKLYEHLVDKYLEYTKFFEQEVGYGIVPIKFFGEETENFQKKIVCITDKKIEN